MLKFSVLTISLCLSPVFGLLETLFQSQNYCHSTCSSKYDVSISKLDACKKGCDFKLHDEDCVVQCKSVSIHEQIQASCLSGCSFDYSVDEKESAESARSPSIVLIRQRPSSELASVNVEPIRLYLNKIKAIQENSDNQYKITHFNSHRTEKIESVSNPLTKFFDDARSQLNNLINKLNNPDNIYISILFVSSIILLYMSVSLYLYTPRNSNVVVNAEELLDDDYDKVLLSKEHNQYMESSPIKVQLSNV